MKKWGEKNLCTDIFLVKNLYENSYCHIFLCKNKNGTEHGKTGKHCFSLFQPSLLFQEGYMKSAVYFIITGVKQKMSELYVY